MKSIDLLVRLSYHPPVDNPNEGEWQGGWIATAEVLGAGPDYAKYQAVAALPQIAAEVAVRERLRGVEG